MAPSDVQTFFKIPWQSRTHRVWLSLSKLLGLNSRRMYGATCISSVEYSRFDDDSQEHCQIKFDKTTAADLKIYESFLGTSIPLDSSNYSCTTSLLHSTSNSNPRRKPSELSPPEFQSQIRNSKLALQVWRTRQFFKLYKLRGYLSFLESLQPKVEDTVESLSIFCDQVENTVDSSSPPRDTYTTETSGHFDSISSEMEDTVSKILVDCENFGQFKTEFNSCLENLDTELITIKKLMTNLFICEYADKEYAVMFEFIQKMYTPRSLSDPPNFDKCLDFIFKPDSFHNEFYLRATALKALYRVMEENRDFSKFNPEIVRLAFNIKKFEDILQSENMNEPNYSNVMDLKNLFPLPLQTIIWGQCVVLSNGEMENTKFLSASDHLEGFIELKEPEENGEESQWIFLPVKDGNGHYFFVVNKKFGSLLSVKRDGPEYRQVHHRPLQLGYFNQHWKILMNVEGQAILKNRAHHQFTLVSNGDGNVVGCVDGGTEKGNVWKIQEISAPTDL